MVARSRTERRLPAGGRSGFQPQRQDAAAPAGWKPALRATANGERRQANGEWRMANGEWRMANGEWRMANGEWRMANGEWRTREPRAANRDPRMSQAPSPRAPRQSATSAYAGHGRRGRWRGGGGR